MLPKTDLAPVPIGGLATQYVAAADWLPLQSSGVGLYNVKSSEYGAKGDGTTDDTAAIQAAITAAASTFVTNGVVPVVYFPPGRYITSSCLVAHDASIAFVGDNEGAVILGPLTITGQIGLFVHPSYKPFAGNTFVTSLVSGPGSACSFNAGTSQSLSFREAVPNVSLGYAATAMCYRFWFKPLATPTATNNAITGFGSDYGYPGSHYPFYFNYDLTSQYEFVFQTSAGRVTLKAPLVNGTAYPIQLDWDGTTVRFFVNGTIISSAALGGNLQAYPTDEFYVGCRVNTAYCNDTFLTANFVIDAIDLAWVSRNTVNFAAPTSKNSVDGNTVFLCNFDQTFDNSIVQIQVPSYGAGARADLIFYYAPTAVVSSAPVNCTFRNITICNCNQGLVHFTGQLSNYENLQFSCRTGLSLDQCFSSQLQNITMSGTGVNPRYGLVLKNQCNDMRIRSLFSQYFDMGWGITGSNEVHIVGGSSLGGYTQAYMQGQDQSSVRDFLFYCAGAAGPNLCNMMVPNIGAIEPITFENCSFSNDNAGMVGGNIYTITGQNLAFRNCAFYGHGDQTYAINDGSPGNLGYGMYLHFDGTYLTNFSGGYFYQPVPTGATIDVSHAYPSTAHIIQGWPSVNLFGLSQDSATTVAHVVDTQYTLATAGARLASWRNNTVEKSFADLNGIIGYPYTNNSGTPGNTTINQPSGRFAIAAAAAACTVTNSTVKATSIVNVNKETNDTTLLYFKVVPAAGSFTVTGNANATAAVTFSFVVTTN